MKYFLLIIVLPVMLVLATLIKNDAHLLDAPGLKKRLLVFLTTNSAQTRDDHDFAELRTPVFTISANQLFLEVQYVARSLEWKQAAADDENQTVRFIIESPLFGFKDDLIVQVRFIDLNHSSLYIRSKSRKGKADFAANASHIQALIKAVRQSIAER